MNRALIPTAFAALLLAASPAHAQYDSSGWTDYRPSQSMFTMAYQMAQPVGGLHDYIGSPSFRGLTFDWQSLLTKSFGGGMRFTWNRFNETISNLSQTTNTGGTISGPVFRYADQFAVEAGGRYFLDMGRDSIFGPFLGVGLGGVWSSSYQQSADLSTSQSGFFFIVTPELGLNITLARGSTNASLNLGFLYNFTTINFRNVSNAQSIAETVGLTFAY